MSGVKDVQTIRVLADPFQEQARFLAALVAKTRTLRQTTNYTGLTRPDRYVHGYLGDLAFESVLKDHGIRYQAHRRTDGQSDRADFTVWKRGRPFDVDVKTAAQAHYRRIMFPDAQWVRKQVDLYVGARLEGHHVAILGFASRSDAVNWDVSTFGNHDVPTRSAPFSELRPIGEMLAHLDRA
jgi:hypothetical protein